MEIKKKTSVIIVLIFSFISFISFISLWSLISGGYDKQNKIVLFLKEIIPRNISRKVRDVLFIVPDLKALNKDLNLQVEKYEQGYSGKLFQTKTVESNKKKYTYKNFFLPFPRLDLRAGYAATKNSTRAHYLEIIDDKIFVISGLGQIIFFDKKNIFNDALDQREIPNNIKTDILEKNNYKLIGIRDVLFKKDYLYISLLFENKDGISINLYRAELNYNKLNFELFFETHEYWKVFNVFSGGRIENFKDKKILFGIGYSYLDGVAQDKNRLLGKIISIDVNSKEHELVSMGHRNPQGLIYIDNLDLIINTEHGPKGGDEINFNYVKKNNLPNYGWDIASYGSPYSGDDHYKKSHKDFGFVEPFKYFTPSIGISEVIFLNQNTSPSKNNTLFVSSLRAGSIYEIELNDRLTKIIKENRFNFGNERIRDIEYDQKYNVIFILFEFTPSIGVLKL